MHSESGSSIDAVARSDAASVAVVDAHEGCIGCGYDLHGLARDGACPECGFSIETTLEEWAGRNTKWLGMLGSGIVVLLAGYYAMLIVVFGLDFLIPAAMISSILVFGGSVLIGTRAAAAHISQHRFQVPVLVQCAGVIVVSVFLGLADDSLIFLLGVAVGLLVFVCGISLLWRQFGRIMGRGLSVPAARLSFVMSWVCFLPFVLGICWAPLAWTTFGSPSPLTIAMGWAAVLAWIGLSLLGIVTLHIAYRANSILLHAAADLERGRQESMETQAALKGSE